MPIYAYFAGRAKFRDELTKGLDYNRLRDQIPDSNTIDLTGWIVAPFAVQQFKLWWAEWKQYLFCASAAVYCNLLDPANIDPNAEVPLFFLADFHLPSFLHIYTDPYCCFSLKAVLPQNTAGVAGR